MEDDLMRIFGSDRMKNMMERLGIAEDQVIENKIISRSIESAQKKVEGHNFDIRKHLVDYDDIINKHRSVIYNSRQNILTNNANDLVLEYIKEEIEKVVSFHTSVDKNVGDYDPKEIIETIRSIFTLGGHEEEKIKKLLQENNKSNNHETRTKVIDHICSLAETKYNNLKEEVNANLEIQEDDLEPIQIIEKSITLRSIDTLWVEHLTAMDKLRTGIGLQGYGQRDPLIEYKREAFGLFNNLLDSIRKQIVSSIYKIGIAKRMSVPGEQKKDYSEQKVGFSPFQKEVKKREEDNQVIEGKIRNEQGEKIGRNDPCHCGSGKKYKKCHGN